MYHEVVDSPVANMDFIMSGGGATTDRDAAVNSLKIKAINAFLQDNAIARSSQMLADLEVRKAERNVKANEVNWTGQAIGIGLVFLVGLVAYKKLS